MLTRGLKKNIKSYTLHSWKKIIIDKLIIKFTLYIFVQVSHLFFVIRLMPLIFLRKLKTRSDLPILQRWVTNSLGAWACHTYTIYILALATFSLQELNERCLVMI